MSEAGPARRQYSEWIDRVVVLILLTALLAVPFVCFNWFATHDGLTYPVRAAEYSYLLLSGEGYPRWAPSFYWGFGYPIFNYFPPLAYFLSHLVMQAGLQAPAAVRCVELFTFLVAFGGLFRLCRLFTNGSGVAFAAAIAGVLAPYRFVDVYVRGDLAESLAFALVPYVFAEAVSCSRRSDLNDGFRLAIMVALVFYSHTLTSFMCSIALAVFGLFHLLRGRAGIFFRVGLWSAAGLLMSAASWLPALLEHKLVNVAVATQARDFYSYFWGDHFIAIWQRLDPRFGFGPSIPGTGDRMNFTASFVMLGAVSWALLKLGSDPGRKRYGPLLLVFATVQFLMLEPSRFVWAHVPFFPFFQFPWRFLILDAILGTILLALVLDEATGNRPSGPPLYIPLLVAGGGLVAALMLTGWSGAISAGNASVASGALAVTALFWVAIRFKGAERAAIVASWLLAVPAMASVIAHAKQTEFPAASVWNNPSFADPEVRERTILRRHDGVIEPLQTTGTNEFLPLTVEPVPGPDIMGVVQYEGETAGSGYRLVQKRGTYHEWEMAVSEAQAVLLPVFYFPGWKAELDGSTARIFPGRFGLIRIELPTGQHRIAIWYEGTTLQVASEVIATVSSVLLAGGWLLWWMRSRRLAGDQGVAGK